MSNFLEWGISIEISVDVDPLVGGYPDVLGGPEIKKKGISIISRNKVQA